MPEHDEQQQDHDFDAITEPTNDNFVQLRDAYKQLKKENQQLRGFREQAEPQLRQAALKEAGFDPESGPAKALLKLHDGELTADALQATATEYGLASGEQPPGQPAATQLSDEQQQAIDAHQRGQQLAAQAAPVEPQTMDAKIAAAEQKGRDTGDWSEFDQLQVEASFARQ